MVFFRAYDSVAGIATGLLARYAEGLAGAEQAAVTSAVEYLHNDGLLPGAVVLLAIVTTLAWPVVVIAAAVALHQAGARRAVVAALASRSSLPSTQASPRPLDSLSSSSRRCCGSARRFRGRRWSQFAR
jgi:hypothetical protein